MNDLELLGTYSQLKNFFIVPENEHEARIVQERILASGIRWSSGINSVQLVADSVKKKISVLNGILYIGTADEQRY